MGTRSLYCIRYLGLIYAMYNHYDSSFEWLGDSLLAELKSLMNDIGYKGICNLFLALREVDEEIKPTEKDIANLKPFIDSDISHEVSTMDWYQLLRNCQGSYLKLFQSGYMLLVCEPSEDIEQSEEFTYILDLDDQRFIGCAGYGDPTTIQSFNLTNLPDHFLVDEDEETNSK